MDRQKTMRIKLRLAIIALFALSITLAVTGVLSAGRFSDVQENDWFYDAAEFVAEEGLFYGTSDTEFSPGLGMTRAMFVTVLGRYVGVPQNAQRVGIVTKSQVNLRSQPNTNCSVITVMPRNAIVSVLGDTGQWYLVQYEGYTGYIRNDMMKAYDGRFADVPSNTYTAANVQWAALGDVVSGISPTAFSPDINISREQICAVLYNYMKVSGITLPVTQNKELFSDDGDISPYAREAVYYMRQAGIVAGTSENLFYPKETATRAEVAELIQGFILALENKDGGTSQPIVYGEPLPASAAVSDSYFDDACFIGHSIISGIQLYAGLPAPDYFWQTGISAYKFLQYSGFSCALPNGGSAYGTIADMLSANEYGKVYIMLGVNELSAQEYQRDFYFDSMTDIVKLFKEKQPDIKIYLISVTPVTRQRSDSTEYYTRENVLAFNELLKRVSLEQEVYYLDIFSLFADSDGYMPSSFCGNDGVHPIPSKYLDIKEYLKTHTAG